MTDLHTRLLEAGQDVSARDRVLRDAVAVRDELVREALAAGMSSREVARLAGISHTWVQQVGRGAEHVA